MKPLLRRGYVLVASVLLFLLTLAGCATSLLYNHADWLIVRQLDGYFDLTRSQKAFVYAKLEGILERHRHEALPRYESIVQEIKGRVRQGLTDQDLTWAFSQYDLLKADLFGRFAPDGAEFIRLVKGPQVTRLRETLQSRLRRDEDSLHDSVEKRLQKRTERILTLSKEWLGSLTKQQEEEITRLVMNFPDTLPTWHEHQRMRSEKLVALIEARRSNETPERLYEWLVEQDKDADRQFVQVSDSLHQHLTRLVLTLDKLATPEQRRYFLAKLDDLARTIHQLREA